MQHRRTPLETEEIEPQSCSIDLRLRLLRQMPFFVDLSDGQVAQINASFREQGFVAGETIYAAGGPATHLYVVAAGKVKLLRHTLAGQDVLLDILGQGEFFGSMSVLGDDTYPDTARAQTACCALGIDAEAFQVILRQYPPVALRALDIVTLRLAAAQEVIRQLSAQPVESRLAATLLKLAARLGEAHDGEILIQMPLTRQDLADMVGATLETTSRIISQFRKAGLLDSGRQWIAIKDRAGLEEIAQG